MVAEFSALIALTLASFAEAVHWQRVHRVSRLAFGPEGKPQLWARTAPFLRVLSIAACTWGMATLYLLQAKVHQAESVDHKDKRHVILALDVSPSMRLQDAGVEGKQSRMRRAAEVMKSFFARVPVTQYKISVIAFYTDAKPVVVDTGDMGVIQNILGDLPMHFAFDKGETNLFSGLEQVARTARSWNPKSTTLIVISDGDTVPASGIPKMPASVADVLIVGIGDPAAGSFIDGRQSRQDVSTLRQVAIRLGGEYHNGNRKHIPSDLLKNLAVSSRSNLVPKLTKREYALLATGLGAAIYSLLPLLLHCFGTGWKPGVRSTLPDNSITSRTDPVTSMT